MNNFNMGIKLTCWVSHHIINRRLPFRGEIGSPKKTIVEYIEHFLEVSFKRNNGDDGLIKMFLSAIRQDGSDNGKFGDGLEIW